jgi:hypothetical protein
MVDRLEVKFGIEGILLLAFLISSTVFPTTFSSARMIRESIPVGEEEIKSILGKFLSEETDNLINMLDNRLGLNWRNKETVDVISNFLEELYNWQMSQEIEVNNTVLTQLKAKSFLIFRKFCSKLPLLPSRRIPPTRVDPFGAEYTIQPYDTLPDAIKKLFVRLINRLPKKPEDFPSHFEMDWAFNELGKREVYEHSVIKFVDEILKNVADVGAFIKVLKWNLEEGMGKRTGEVTVPGAIEIKYTVSEKHYFHKMVYDPLSGEWEPEAPFKFDYDAPFFIELRKTIISREYQNVGKIRYAIPLIPK